MFGFIRVLICHILLSWLRLVSFIINEVSEKKDNVIHISVMGDILSLLTTANEKFWDVKKLV